MTSNKPRPELEPMFSSPAATAEPWSAAVEQLESAGVYWISTVRPDGRPHVTPLIAVWHDDALWFTTGEQERKARNLTKNPHCVLTTGCNDMQQGLDIVLEGTAERVTHEPKLRELADAYETKYGADWRFTVHDGAFTNQGGHQGSISLVFCLAATKGLGFRRGTDFGQTRWRVG